MVKRAHSTGGATLAATVVIIGLAACGGGGSTSGTVLARVGSTPITRAELNHWMSSLAGADYYGLSAKHTIPAGLVSDPPNFAACVAHLEAAAVPNKVSSQPTGVQLLGKCRELYAALKRGAMEFLVGAEWVTGMARIVGVSLTEGELQQDFKRSTAERFTNDSEFHSYLTSTRQSPSDRLLEVKLQVLGRAVVEKLAAAGKQGPRRLAEAERRLTSETTCQPGYVVEHCKQFSPHTAIHLTQPASVLLEQVASLATGRCTNLAACARQ